MDYICTAKNEDMQEQQTFTKRKFNSGELEEEYLGCIFTACDFSNLVIGDTLFEECVFNDCNFTMTRFDGALREVSFVACKLTGADFSGLCHLSNTLSFKDCRMEYTLFVGTRLRKLKIKNCSLQNAVFDRADIAGSRFPECNLDGASFVGTHLEHVDFSEACNYTLRPGECHLQKTIFSESGLRGLVSHLNIVIR